MSKGKKKKKDRKRERERGEVRRGRDGERKQLVRSSSAVFAEKRRQLVTQKHPLSSSPTPEHRCTHTAARERERWRERESIQP